jgi:hypothetical protein
MEWRDDYRRMETYLTPEPHITYLIDCQWAGINAQLGEHMVKLNQYFHFPYDWRSAQLHIVPPLVFDNVVTIPLCHPDVQIPTTKTFVYETLYTIITFFLYLQSKYKTSIISLKFIQWQTVGRNSLFFYFYLGGWVSRIVFILFYHCRLVSDNAIVSNNLIALVPRSIWRAS